MPIAKLSQKINQPVETVFQTVTDVTSFPQWNPTTRTARRLTQEPTGNGTRFEMSITGFGKQELIIEEYQENKQVRLVPVSNMFDGGHRFVFYAEGNATRIEHELEMNAKGLFKLLTPLMGLMSGKNLRDTALALETHLHKQSS